MPTEKVTVQLKIDESAALHAIVLAAGASTRFGAPKQLARLDGRPLLQVMVERLESDDTGPEWIAELCLLKNHATQTMQWCADAAVQILGGMGYMRGTRSERIYREVKVMMIGGGAEEIMKELAARQLGV